MKYESRKGAIEALSFEQMIHGVEIEVCCGRSYFPTIKLWQVDPEYLGTGQTSEDRWFTNDGVELSVDDIQNIHRTREMQNAQVEEQKFAPAKALVATLPKKKLRKLSHDFNELRHEWIPCVFTGPNTYSWNDSSFHSDGYSTIHPTNHDKRLREEAEEFFNAFPECIDLKMYAQCLTGQINTEKVSKAQFKNLEPKLKEWSPAYGRKDAFGRIFKTPSNVYVGILHYVMENDGHHWAGRTCWEYYKVTKDGFESVLNPTMYATGHYQTFGSWGVTGVETW